jgi:hypothetical protein
MILNENFVNYKVLAPFEYDNFGLASFSIWCHLKKNRITEI